MESNTAERSSGIFPAIICRRCLVFYAGGWFQKRGLLVQFWFGVVLALLASALPFVEFSGPDAGPITWLGPLLRNTMYTVLGIIIVFTLTGGVKATKGFWLPAILAGAMIGGLQIHLRYVSTKLESNAADQAQAAMRERQLEQLEIDRELIAQRQEELGLKRLPGQSLEDSLDLDGLSDAEANRYRKAVKRILKAESAGIGVEQIIPDGAVPQIDDWRNRPGSG